MGMCITRRISTRQPCKLCFIHIDDHVTSVVSGRRGDLILYACGVLMGRVGDKLNGSGNVYP